MNQKVIIKELRDWTGWAMGAIGLLIGIITFWFNDREQIENGADMSTLEIIIPFIYAVLFIFLGLLIRYIVKKQIDKSMDQHSIAKLLTIEKRLDTLESKNYLWIINENNHLLQREINSITADSLKSIGKDDLEAFLKEQNAQIEHITKVNERNSGEGIKKKDAQSIASRFMIGSVFQPYMDTN